MLAEHHEKAFSKAELHQHLWPNTFVSDGSLTILVAEIREVLADNAEQPEYVRTVRRFGYAFCAAVVTGENAKPSEAPLSSGWLIWGDKSIGLAEGETLLAGQQTRMSALMCPECPGVTRASSSTARVLLSKT